MRSPKTARSGNPSSRDGDDDTHPTAAPDNLPRLVKVEANLLRLPLFALQTKGLRSLDGIECSGTITRGGETHQFTFVAARSTITPYPGPLARKAHFAILSLATDGGFPVENPISWTWRDLCRRMDTCYSGREVRQLKAAIESTKALYIKSDHAIYSKSEGRLLRPQEEGLNLYDRFSFVGTPLPDGEIADRNYLWLAPWYLDNINAFFTAPLDYELWRYLEKRSPIASRLYEFLLLNFYSGAPKLRINYEKLAQFLPIKAEAYPSQAKQQLDPAFRLLCLTDVIEKAAWSESKSGLGLIHLYRGKNLTSARGRQPALDFDEEEFAGSFEVRELRNQRPPEWQLVSDFYQGWAGEVAHQPSKKELESARELVANHGLKKAKDVLLRAIKKLKTHWPEAKTFGAISKYLPQALGDYDRDQDRIEREQREQLRRKKERDDKRRSEAELADFEARWRPAWDRLPKNEQAKIRDEIIGNRSFLRSVPTIVDRLCLAALARREGCEAIPDDLDGAHS